MKLYYISHESKALSTFSMSQVHWLWESKCCLSQVWACCSVSELCRVALLIVNRKHTRKALFCLTANGRRRIGNCGCAPWAMSAMSERCHWHGPELTAAVRRAGEKRREGTEWLVWRRGFVKSERALKEVVRKRERDRERLCVREEDVVAREQQWIRTIHLFQPAERIKNGKSRLHNGPNVRTGRTADPDSEQPKRIEEKVGRCDYITTTSQLPSGWHHHNRIRARGWGH